MPVGFGVLVEQYLFARDVGVLVEYRRAPVIRCRHRAAAVRPVLLSLETASVVPPVSAPGGHREVGLLGAGSDLLEDHLSQRLLISRLGLHVCVLRFKVGDDLGIGLVAQPLVVVDEDVVVVGA